LIVLGFGLTKYFFFILLNIKGYITLVVRRLLLKYILSIICFDHSLSCRFSDVVLLGPLIFPSKDPHSPTPVPSKNRHPPSKDPHFPHFVMSFGFYFLPFVQARGNSDRYIRRSNISRWTARQSMQICK